MKLDDLVSALDLPQSCRVDQRVPKNQLIENTSMTSKDRRLINESIEGIQWLAALKPNSVGLAEFRDDTREYLEIALLVVTLRETKRTTVNVARLIELLHRAIPYPILLLIQWEPNIMLSLGHKRMALNEMGKIVLDGNIVVVTFPEDCLSESIEKAFLQALALRHQPQANIFTLYQSWIDILYALLTAKISGAFSLAVSAEQAAIRRQAYEEFHTLEIESARLRANARREKQVANQVELNLALQSLKTKITDTRGRL